MTPKIKILETIRQGKIGGGETHVLDLIGNMDRSRFEPIVLSFTEGPMVDRVKALGVEVHVRSSFLQGLLLMPRDKIPDQFRAWDSLWDDWHEWLVKHAVSPVDACIAYVLSHCNIDQVVVGVDSKLQLEQIVSAIECNSIKAFPDINSLDSNLINPNNWKTT